MDLEKLSKMLEIANQFQDQNFWNGLGNSPRQSVYPNSEQHSAQEHSLPLIDLLVSDEEVLVVIDLPGLKKEDIQIYLSGEMLTIKGPPYDIKGEGKSFIMSERLHRNFERTIELPDHIIPSKISSRFQDGVLKIEIPRSATIQKSIKIR